MATIDPFSGTITLEYEFRPCDPRPFKPGDVVRLKGSGGPPMAVAKVIAEGAFCRWYDHANHMQHDLIELAALQHDTRR